MVLFNLLNLFVKNTGCLVEMALLPIYKQYNQFLPENLQAHHHKQLL